MWCLTTAVLLKRDATESILGRFSIASRIERSIVVISMDGVCFSPPLSSTDDHGPEVVQLVVGCWLLVLGQYNKMWEQHIIITAEIYDGNFWTVFIVDLLRLFSSLDGCSPAFLILVSYGSFLTTKRGGGREREVHWRTEFLFSVIFKAHCAEMTPLQGEFYWSPGPCQFMFHRNGLIFTF